jgi:Ras homolog gene family, member A
MLYETSVVELRVDGQLLELEMWSTCLQEDYNRLRHLSYQEAAVIVLVFAIDEPRSFQSITERWHPEVAHFCSIPKVPLVLVGCKLDMRLKTNVVIGGSDQTNCVKKEQGHGLANWISAVAYLECSAKSREGMEEAMMLIAKTAISWDPRAIHKSNRECIVL